MSKHDAHSRQAWRVRGQLQDYLVVKRSDLTVDEASNCLPSVVIVAELDRWLSSVFGRRVCHELHEVVTGTALNDLLLRRSSVDRAHLKRCIAEAFRNGTLAALPLGPIRLKQSGGGASDKSSPPPVAVPLLAEVPPANKAVDKTETQEQAWVAVELVNEHGKPVSNVRYRIVLPDGTKREGRLDSNGYARIDNVAVGSCQISFPELDGDSWALSQK